MLLSVKLLQILFIFFVLVITKINEGGFTNSSFESKERNISKNESKEVDNDDMEVETVAEPVPENSTKDDIPPLKNNPTPDSDKSVNEVITNSLPQSTKPEIREIFSKCSPTIQKMILNTLQPTVTKLMTSTHTDQIQNNLLECLKKWEELNEREEESSDTELELKLRECLKELITENKDIRNAQTSTQPLEKELSFYPSGVGPYTELLSKSKHFYDGCTTEHKDPILTITKQQKKILEYTENVADTIDLIKKLPYEFCNMMLNIWKNYLKKPSPTLKSAEIYLISVIRNHYTIPNLDHLFTRLLHLNETLSLYEQKTRLEANELQLELYLTQLDPETKQNVKQFLENYKKEFVEEKCRLEYWNREFDNLIIQMNERKVEQKLNEIKEKEWVSKIPEINNLFTNEIYKCVPKLVLLFTLQILRIRQELEPNEKHFKNIMRDIVNPGIEKWKSGNDPEARSLLAVLNINLQKCRREVVKSCKTKKSCSTSTDPLDLSNLNRSSTNPSFTGISTDEEKPNSRKRFLQNSASFTANSNRATKQSRVNSIPKEVINVDNNSDDSDSRGEKCIEKSLKKLNKIQQSFEIKNVSNDFAKETIDLNIPFESVTDNAPENKGKGVAIQDNDSIIGIEFNESNKSKILKILNKLLNVGNADEKLKEALDKLKGNNCVNFISLCRRVQEVEDINFQNQLWFDVSTALRFSYMTLDENILLKNITTITDRIHAHQNQVNLMKGIETQEKELHNFLNKAKDRSYANDMQNLLANFEYLKNEGHLKTYSEILNSYIEAFKTHLINQENFPTSVIQYQFISPFQQFQFLPNFEQQQQFLAPVNLSHEYVVQGSNVTQQKFSDLGQPSDGSRNSEK